MISLRTAPTNGGARWSRETGANRRPALKSWLLDTGPVVAYLNGRDPDHLAVCYCLDGFRGQLVTTGAVITEAMHMLAAAPEGPNLLANFVAASGLAIYDYSQPEALRAAADLMAKYQDIPMDYADATLVLLGTDLNLKDVLTLDRRGFTVFRLPRKRRFRLVLDQP